MKLFHSPASPFSRKVVACAVTREIDAQIELVAVNATISPAALLAVNPLSKIPTLVTEDGVAIYDSPVICEYLDTIGDAPALFPPSGRTRWRALQFQAMADGIMDAAVLRRAESLRPQEAARDLNMLRQHAAVTRTLAALESDLPHHVADIGSLAVACALGYLDLRFAHEPWRDANPALAAWYEAIASQPGLVATTPKDPAA
jgi:glutathione S-transferase